MGFRFRKSITIVAGLKLNISNKSPSLTIGGRGASITLGRKGTYANLGLGGGLSYRTRLGKAASASNADARARAESKEQLRNALLADIERMSQVTRQIIDVHMLTPDPSLGITLSELREHYLMSASSPYAVEPPVRPAKPEPLSLPERPVTGESVGFFKRLFQSDAERQELERQALSSWECAVADCEREQALAEHRYQESRMKWAEQYALWQSEAARHQEARESASASAKDRFISDAPFFESILDAVLQDIDWPRDTSVSFEVVPEQSLVRVDVDLPEVEDLPQSIFTLNRQGSEIVEKEMTQKAIREAYARHIHGVLFRLIGVCFYALPFDRVDVSGFTQRLSKATGRIDDEYIIQCTALRDVFSSINFQRLCDVDPVESLSVFSPNRQMSSAYVFKPIVLTS